MPHLYGRPEGEGGGDRQTHHEMMVGIIRITSPVITSM